MKRTNLSLFFILILTMVLVQTESFAETATAVIQGTKEGTPIFGAAIFEDTDEGLRIEVDLYGASPGLHGFHIHENGSCQDNGQAAGGHFNPKNADHGLLLKDGLERAHAGDLGNLKVNQNGEGNLYLVIPGLTLGEGEYGVGGRSIILHEKEDDFGQPAGNAGGRIACGVIQVEK